MTRRTSLVLQLKLDGDPVIVADQISVKVVGVKHRKVKLLFEAPVDVRIDRYAIWIDRQGLKSRRRTA